MLTVIIVIIIRIDASEEDDDDDDPLYDVDEEDEHGNEEDYMSEDEYDEFVEMKMSRMSLGGVEDTELPPRSAKQAEEVAIDADSDYRESSDEVQTPEGSEDEGLQRGLFNNTPLSMAMPSSGRRVLIEEWKMILGSMEEHYNLLHPYIGELRRVNNTSLFELVLDRTHVPARFERSYIDFDNLKQGFLRGCRPIIGLDGCFLNTHLGG
ncbi:hypothetical protein CRG98_003006 [Punica granatum]|uniref:Uncharacterized protein n=1 Tax=Punica granatum TaxID=22663 RepID=A0A2I0L7M1_PUNGR|nr:hypothetical protein CRG98_003006 [Punica granatum]